MPKIKLKNVGIEDKTGLMYTKGTLKKLMTGNWLRDKGSVLGKHLPTFEPSGSSWICERGILALSLLIQLLMSLVIVVASQILFYQLSKINVFHKSGFNNLRELVFLKLSILRGLNKHSDPKELSIVSENNIKHNERWG